MIFCWNFKTFCYNTVMKSPEFAGQQNIEYSESEKRQKYEEICEGVPDAIFVFGGTIVENKVTGKLESGGYDDVDHHGLMAGSKGRSIAAAELAQQFPDAKLVATSKIPTRGEVPEQPLAKVTARELAEYGADAENIITYEESYSTMTELFGLIKMAVEHQWDNIVVVTNETQTERTRLQLENILSIKDNNESYQKAWDEVGVENLLEDYNNLNPKIVFVAAEEVLPIRDSRYDALIEKVRTTDMYKKRLASETKAEQDILSGNFGKPENKLENFIEHPTSEDLQN